MERRKAHIGKLWSAARHGHLAISTDMDTLKLMSVLVGQPFLGLAPAAIFLVCFAITKSKWALVAGSLWLMYCPYELAMKFRWLCSGECNIRIDLLAIYPLLLAMSLAAVAAMCVAAYKRRKA